MTRHCPPAARRRQRGAATLIVVMVMFFIISLVAAYTNRNLIFEQRTSANQYRSTQALEVAEAGLEWAVSMLNTGRINASCQSSTNTANSSFRSRYLVIDDVSGKITPAPNPAGGELNSSCVWTGTAWSCACPTTGAATLTPPTGPAQAPAFRVRFTPVRDSPGGPVGVPQQPGVVWIQVVGCTRLDSSTGEQCLTFGGQGALNEGRVVVSSMLALGGSAVGMPQAALTARGAVNVSGSLTAYNTGLGTSGLTVHSGGAVNTATVVARSTPGSPSESSVIQTDAALTLVGLGPFSANERMFASVFNLRPDSFRTQQGAIVLTCPTDCTAAAVRTTLSLNPGRPLWLTGDLTVDSGGDIGSASAPALLVVNGNVLFATSGVTIHGLIYTRPTGVATDWVTTGSGQVTGAVVAEGGVSGAGNTTVVYDSDVLRRVRFNVGSFVRVPGSWRDFAW